MYLILHNPRCQKSRLALEHLTNLNEEIEVREYLKAPLNREELSTLLKKLEGNPENLIRKKEKTFIELNWKGALTKEQIVDLLVKYPILLERPIIVNDKMARIARGPEVLKEII